jgi:hypothetical protein
LLLMVLAIELELVVARENKEIGFGTRKEVMTLAVSFENCEFAKQRKQNNCVRIKNLHDCLQKKCDEQL